ncbi:MAG: type III pantothenate kinase [Longimicrobiales bacterium]
MIIAFDVGNTETLIGLFRDHELTRHWRISTRASRTSDEIGLLLRGLLREAGEDTAEISGAVLASVVPTATTSLSAACERHLGAPAHIVRADSPLPIRIDIDEPLTVGPDRVVNTLAAARLYGRDTIAVDLGTATTFDCITADGVFIGGVIAPGVHTGAESLVRRTARLPLVGLERPPRVIGRRTESALHSGIFFGAVAAIDGIVRRIREEWQRPAVLVVATGGLATLLAPHCETVEKIEPFLTLYGLELAFQHLAGD